MEQEQQVAVSLEEPTEIQTPVEETAPAPEAVPDGEPEPEGVVFDARGQKLVPLGAVLSERGKRKEAEKLAQAKDAEIAAYKPKAEEFEKAKRYLDEAKPYIEKARADLQRQQQPPAPAVDPALEQYAKDFDLYTAEGKPDVTRAQRIMAFHDDRAQKLAQQAVAPIMQTEANRTAQNLYQQYVSKPEINGVKVDGKMLAEAFNMVGPEVIAQNPAVAEVLFMNTIGRQILMGQKPMTAPPPVVATESIGGNRTSDSALNADSIRFQQASNLKPKEYQEVRERYKTGQANSLE